MAKLIVLTSNDAEHQLDVSDDYEIRGPVDSWFIFKGDDGSELAVHSNVVVSIGLHV